MRWTECVDVSDCIICHVVRPAKFGSRFQTSFDDVNLVLQRFSSTNYVVIPGHVGRELRGAPMGDALGGACNLARVQVFTGAQHDP